VGSKSRAAGVGAHSDVFFVAAAGLVGCLRAAGSSWRRSCGRGAGVRGQPNVTEMVVDDAWTRSP
jgi:hypothetical protein